MVICYLGDIRLKITFFPAVHDCLPEKWFQRIIEVRNDVTLKNPFQNFISDDIVNSVES